VGDHMFEAVDGKLANRVRDQVHHP
jgi:hypothetical protein